MTLRRVIDWLFRDRRTGRIVIGQWPNLWLWTFIAASVAAVVAGPGTPAGTAIGVVGKLALAVWALDELLRGVNPWRRILGATVLIWGAVTLLH